MYPLLQKYFFLLITIQRCHNSEGIPEPDFYTTKDYFLFFLSFFFSFTFFFRFYYKISPLLIKSPSERYHLFHHFIVTSFRPFSFLYFLTFSRRRLVGYFFSSLCVLCGLGFNLLLLLLLLLLNPGYQVMCLSKSHFQVYGGFLIFRLFFVPRRVWWSGYKKKAQLPKAYGCTPKPVTYYKY